MIPIPDDDLGRFWLAAEWSQSPSEEKKIIGTLVTADEEQKLLVLGNAFVILGNDDNAICLGAAHSFETVKHLQQGLAQFNVPPDFRAKGPEYLTPNTIHVFFVIEGEPVVCQIGQLNYIQNYDVVAFTVHAPEGRQIFKSHVSMDLAAPKVGDEIAVMAYDIALDKQSDGKGILNQKFNLRLGVVTEVEMGPSALPGQSFYFRTTIPLTPGMSGAPVLNKPVAGQPVIVRGIVSSDISEPEAFKSFLVPGRSTASMLWPTMGLTIDIQLQPDAEGNAFLGDLLNKQVLDDRTIGVKIQVRQAGGGVEILYADEQTQPQSRILLSWPGNQS